MSKERRSRGTRINAHGIDSLAQPSCRLRKPATKSVAGKVVQTGETVSTEAGICSRRHLVALTEAMSFLKVGRSWVSATRAQSSSSQSVGEMTASLFKRSLARSLAHMCSWLPPYRSKFACSRSTSCRCIPRRNTVPQLRVHQPQHAALSTQKHHMEVSRTASMGGNWVSCTQAAGRLQADSIDA